MATFDEGISETLAVIRRMGPMTRAEIVEESGLSRSAINLRLEALLGAELVVGGPGEVPTKGRPADQFAFNPTRGRVLLADIGVTKFRAGLCDLGGNIEIEQSVDADVTQPPDVLLDLVLSVFEELLATTSTSREAILGIGISVPAPVKRGSGMSVNPPIIPRWNRFDVPEWFASAFTCPVFLEKDTNAMAFGESRLSHPGASPLMMVKIGTGIGSGLVHDGRLFRGADGAAGDLGHTQIHLNEHEEGPVCKCGNHGCLEAYAGGWALQRDLQAAGMQVPTQQALAELLIAGDPETVRLVRRSGRLIGSAIASAVNLINPRVVVIGGRMVSAGGDHLFAGIREMVYRRSLPLATSDLQIVRSDLYPRAGLIGLSHLVSDEILAPDRIGRLLAGTELAAR